MSSPVATPPRYFSPRRVFFLLFLLIASVWILLRPVPLQTDEGEAGGVSYHITYHARLSHREAIEQKLLHLQRTVPHLPDTAFVRHATQAVQQLLHNRKASDCHIRLKRTARH